MKNWKHGSLIGLIALLGVFFSGCNSSNGNSLNGLWEEKPNQEFSATILFSGNNVVLTKYPHFLWENTKLFGWRPKISYIATADSSVGDQMVDMLSLFVSGIPIEDEVILPEPNSFEIPEDLYKGNENGRHRYVAKGTYSIWNDKMEVTFSNGKVVVYSFSRTENTLKLSGLRFTRKR